MRRSLDTPHSSTRKRAAHTDSTSRVRTLMRSHVPSPGSAMNAIDSRSADSTARSTSLKAALVRPPSNQRTIGAVLSSRHVRHGAHGPIFSDAAAVIASQPLH
eukprot:2294114-Prymnesium_polylepis.2